MDAFHEVSHTASDSERGGGVGWMSRPTPPSTSTSIEYATSNGIPPKPITRGRSAMRKLMTQGW